jgi:purine-binding chemotaxis protein CheW
LVTIKGRAHAETKILVFEIGHDTYGVNIGTVSEVIRPRAITPVPGAANYVLGLINIRGSAVPLFDLSLYLGAGADDGPQANVVLLGEAPDALGLRVGNVLAVETVQAADIQHAGAVLADAHASLFDGMIEADGRLIGLLRLEGIVEGLLAGSTA